LLGWLEIIETGVQVIDADHRDLIERCDALTVMVANNAPWRALYAAAYHLAERCQQHFEREEAILVWSEFPRCEAHMHEHRRCGTRLQKLVGCIARTNAEPHDHLKIVDGLRDLLVDLLVRHDLDYKSHLQHAIGR
jgi:hemerythrin